MQRRSEGLRNPVNPVATILPKDAEKVRSDEANIALSKLKKELNATIRITHVPAESPVSALPTANNVRVSPLPIINAPRDAKKIPRIIRGLPHPNESLTMPMGSRATAIQRPYMESTRPTTDRSIVFVLMYVGSVGT
jgi:hypothetical protein